MIPDTYKLIERCVEDGVTAGYRRAFKHTDNPTETQVIDAVCNAVMLEISEWFKFPEIETEEQ